MDRTQAMAELPEAYATALRLREAGVDDAGIAERLGTPPDAVGPLLRLAVAKLDRILAANEDAHENEGAIDQPENQQS
jgi:DNA-directed RNA polymerase specialized sigma24 family protein